MTYWQGKYKFWRWVPEGKLSNPSPNGNNEREEVSHNFVGSRILSYTVQIQARMFKWADLFSVIKKQREMAQSIKCTHV